jgi:hypothetical protein
MTQEKNRRALSGQRKYFKSGLPDFSWYNIPTKMKNVENIPNNLKIYQITLKYTKWPQNIPNGLKIDKMA